MAMQTYVEKKKNIITAENCAEEKETCLSGMAMQMPDVIFPGLVRKYGCWG